MWCNDYDVNVIIVMKDELEEKKNNNLTGGIDMRWHSLVLKSLQRLITPCEYTGWIKIHS